MALSARSSVTHTASHKLTSIDSSKRSSFSSLSNPQGLVPLPAKPTFEGSGLRRTKSRKPINASSSSGTHSNEVHSLESAITKVGADIATTSGEILDAVDSVIEDGTTTSSNSSRGRRSRTTGKMNSRMSRRRALVMCLALGMVRPCASTGESGGGGDLRRTVSELPIARTTSMQVGGSLLMSQVSLATSLKQTNVFGQKEDLQKLTMLQ